MTTESERQIEISPEVLDHRFDPFLAPRANP